MFNNSLMADIWFVVGESRRVPAHKYILATGSTVFYAMLYGSLADDRVEEIVVPDVDPDAFLALLNYLYCDEIRLEPDNVLATLYAAKKYIVPHLARSKLNTYLPIKFLTSCRSYFLLQYRNISKTIYCRECVKYLETSLSARNACLLLSQSRLFEEPELMQRCWDVIDAQVNS